MKTIILLSLISSLLFGQVDTVGITGGSVGVDQPATVVRYNYFPGDSLTKSGTLLKIGMQREEGATTMSTRWALYSDNAGSVGSLLAETVDTTVNTTGWYYLSLTTDIKVTAGTAYWIGAKNSATVRWYAYSSGFTNHRAGESDSYSNPWPASATPSSYQSDFYNMRLIIKQGSKKKGYEKYKKYGGY